MNEVAGVAAPWYASLFIAFRSIASRTACRTPWFLKYWFLVDSWMKSTRVDGKRSTSSFGLALICDVRLPGGFSITSTLPASRARTRLLSLVMILTLTLLIFGLVPYQYGFFLRSTSLVAL